MNNKISKEIEIFKEKIKPLLSDNCITFSLFLSAQEDVLKIRERTAEDLKAQGISMRNIKGSYIK